MTYLKIILLNITCGFLISCVNHKGEPNIHHSEDNGYIYITSNGIPHHKYGNFPNRRNPNALLEQQYYFRVPKTQYPSEKPIALNRNMFFGTTTNGIPFDPFTNEYWRNDKNSGWNYEAMSNNIDLGLDNNNAHVNPTGAYHYHGIPYNAYLSEHNPHYHSPLIGYAADGYPIYTLYGYSHPSDIHSPVKKIQSSFDIKPHTRTSGPGGEYDGTFVKDYQYIPLLGDLDQCNGRYGITPEYPEGIYHYFLTDSFPFIPRCFRGKPDESFYKKKKRRKKPRPFLHHMKNSKNT